MVEAFSGYRTSCGKTFESLHEAERHEAVDAVMEELSGSLGRWVQEDGGAVLNTEILLFLAGVIARRGRKVCEVLSRLPTVS